MPGRLGAPETAAADTDGRDRCCCPRHLVGTGAEDSTRDLRIVSCKTTYYEHAQSLVCIPTLDVNVVATP